MLKSKKRMMMILFFLILILVSFIIFFYKEPFLKILYPKTYQEIISEYEGKYKVEGNLIFAVIKAESNFEPEAISSRGAIGLMQLMEETAKDVAKKNDIEINGDHLKKELCDVNKNIEIGTCYLATLMQRYENKEVALAAYNAGIGTVDGWIQKGIIKKDGTDIENIPYQETNHYVRKILRDYKIYEKLYR